MESKLTLSLLRGSLTLSNRDPGLTPGAILCRSLRELVELYFLTTLVAIVCFSAAAAVIAQTNDSPFPQATALQHGPPLTNQEYVALLYQLPANPEARDRLIDEIRKRGIGFAITPGLLSLTATKSGNDSLLRHTLEEANRRRVNPTTSTLPPAAESLELLERTRKATLGAAGTMPDYLVKELIVRYFALGNSENWQPADHLSVAVSYRQSSGEQYKLLSVNGMPPNVDEKEQSTYGDKIGGTTSSGEYVSILSEIFAPETKTEFQAVDTDELHGRRTIVYEYAVRREFSHQGLRWEETPKLETVVAYHGRLWIDRETNRVLRLEDVSAEIPADFPITAAANTIDYDWVTINDQRHLLPSRAVVQLTSRVGTRVVQSRNDILFRGYRKFGAEVKITDLDEKDFPPDKPEEPEPEKPGNAPVLKPAQPKKP